MSCVGKTNPGTGHCVADVLREIVAAQDNIVGDTCDSSCERSITNLLGEAQPITTNLDTVPVLLYCKDCTPFEAFGAPFDAIADVVGSFYFRVNSIDQNNCAILELLREVGSPADPVSPVEQPTSDLVATGICITVDVDCFCHVTCLPPIAAL